MIHTYGADTYKPAESEIAYSNRYFFRGKAPFVAVFLRTKLCHKGRPKSADCHFQLLLVSQTNVTADSTCRDSEILWV
jgi:hypothetical protein